MIEVIFKIFLTDYIDFQGFITKRIQKPLLIEYNLETDIGGARALGLDAIFYNPERIAHDTAVTLEIYCLSELQRHL
jgi:FMN phosphatase YigB (HAD superfamily)